MEHVIGLGQAQQLHHAVMLRPVRELQVARCGLAEIIHLHTRLLPSHMGLSNGVLLHRKVVCRDAPTTECDRSTQ